LADIDGNVEMHLEFIGQAQAAGADLLVFPELSLTGYATGERSFEVAISTEGSLDPRLERLSTAAGELTVVVGFVEESLGAQFYNAAAVLRGGDVVFVHRKVNLANYGDMEEAKYFAPGRYIDTVALSPPFHASVLLCSDMWNPALVHLAALHGATVLVVPTNSSLDARSGDVSKPERWDLALRFYASLYGMPVVFANRIGTEDLHAFWGGSRILDAHGHVVVQAKSEEETLLVAELHYDDVRLARFRLPTVRDSNLALIQREIDRLTGRIGVPDVIGRL
jgi:predicted amidohydrolase